MMAQPAQTAQLLSVLLHGACLLGEPLSWLSMQLVDISMPGIIIDIPEDIDPPADIAAPAQAGATPLRNIPSATIIAAIWRVTSRSNMA